jgi:hypothetical protein
MGERIMRRLLLFAIPAALLMVSPYAGAQSQDYPLIEHSEVSTIQVRADRPYHFTAQKTEDIKGTYDLSNGWTLHVRPAAHRGIIAQIDSQPPMRLVALSDDRFTTVDGNVQMHFDLGSLGDDMSMTYVPSSRSVAWITVTSNTMAAR